MDFLMNYFLDLDWTAAAFYALFSAVLISALLVVFLNNIVHSVLWLVVCFLSMAGIFLTLNADFLALVQVLVYAGAVCIMLVFGIMLIRRKDMDETNLFHKRILFPGLLALLVTFLSGYIGYRTQVMLLPVPVPEDTVGNIADLLLSRYVIPFEVAGILLTVALVGSIFIAGEVKADAGSDR